MATKIPNPLNLTIKQLELLDILKESGTQYSSEAAMLMDTSPSAVGRVMTSLSKKSLAFHERTFESANLHLGAWSYRISDEGIQYVDDNQEAIKLMRDATGITAMMDDFKGLEV